MGEEVNSYNHWASFHLDEDQSARFFVNISKEEESIDPLSEVEEKSFMYSAFIWETSNEGHQYWENIQNKLDEKYGWVVI